MEAYCIPCEGVVAVVYDLRDHVDVGSTEVRAEGDEWRGASVRDWLGRSLLSPCNPVRPLKPLFIKSVKTRKKTRKNTKRPIC